MDDDTTVPDTAAAPEAPAEEAPLEERLAGGVETVKATADDLKRKLRERLSLLGKKAGESYQSASEAVKGADLGEKARAIGASIGERARAIGAGIGERAKGAREGLKKTLTDGKDRITHAPDPEKQIVQLQELVDTMLLYDPVKRTNPTLRDEAMTRVCLVTGTTVEDNAALMETLVEYAAERAGEKGLPYKTVRVDSTYVVDNSSLKSNENLKRLLTQGTDQNGIALILVEDADLLYRETDRHGTPLFNNRARLNYLVKKAMSLGEDGEYAGNWLMVLTTADRASVSAEFKDLINEEI